MYYLDRLPVGFSLATLRASPLIRCLRVWLRYRQNLRQLESLDEHTLKDIGADRGAILHRAWQDACDD